MPGQADASRIELLPDQLQPTVKELCPYVTAKIGCQRDSHRCPPTMPLESLLATAVPCRRANPLKRTRAKFHEKSKERNRWSRLRTPGGEPI
jgi:hypothetical protein